MGKLARSLRDYLCQTETLIHLHLVLIPMMATLAWFIFWRLP